MGTVRPVGGVRSLDVSNGDDMEPEDMKCRRLAALKEFGLRNPKYKEVIKVQLKLESRGATARTQASPRQLTPKGHGEKTQPKQTVRSGRSYTKKSRWTTKSSLELLEAVTRFEKSGSKAVGKEKWQIIAADLMRQPEGFPAIMSLTEFAEYCRIRCGNMFSRRHIDGSSYSLPDELKEKLEEISRLIGKASPLSCARGETSRKNCRTPLLRKKNRLVRLAISQSDSSECKLN